MVVPSQHSLSAPLWSSIPAGPSLSAQRCFRQRLTLWLLVIELVDLARYFCQHISSILKAKLFSFLPSYSISAHKLLTRAIVSLDWFHSCHLLLCFGEIKYCLQKSWVLSVNPHFFNSTNKNTDKDQMYQIRSLFLNQFRLKITTKLNTTHASLSFWIKLKGSYQVKLTFSALWRVFFVFQHYNISVWVYMKTHQIPCRVMGLKLLMRSSFVYFLHPHYRYPRYFYVTRECNFPFVIDAMWQWQKHALKTP